MGTQTQKMDEQLEQEGGSRVLVTKYKDIAKIQRKEIKKVVKENKRLKKKLKKVKTKIKEMEKSIQMERYDMGINPFMPYKISDLYGDIYNIKPKSKKKKIPKVQYVLLPESYISAQTQVPKLPINNGSVVIDDGEYRPL